MGTNCFQPHGLSSASDWLPGYERRQWSCQSEARIPVIECYGILTCGALAVSHGAWLASTKWNAIFSTNKFTVHSQNKNRRRFPLKRQNLTALFAKHWRKSSKISISLFGKSFSQTLSECHLLIRVKKIGKYILILKLEPFAKDYSIAYILYMIFWCAETMQNLRWNNRASSLF